MQVTQGQHERLASDRRGCGEDVHLHVEIMPSVTNKEESSIELKCLTSMVTVTWIYSPAKKCMTLVSSGTKIRRVDTNASPRRNNHQPDDMQITTQGRPIHPWLVGVPSAFKTPSAPAQDDSGIAPALLVLPL